LGGDQSLERGYARSLGIPWKGGIRRKSRSFRGNRLSPNGEAEKEGWEFGSGLTEEFDYRMAQTSPDAGVALTPDDEPGHLNVYIETADLDAALSKVQELGGEVGEIHVVPDRLTAEIPSLSVHGRFATCKDSEGNEFHLLQRDASYLLQRDARLL
jgi:predicted enzyme related to lactoylglutathione lyase